jgi:hypothetical protein
MIPHQLGRVGSDDVRTSRQKQMDGDDYRVARRIARQFRVHSILLMECEQ